MVTVIAFLLLVASFTVFTHNDDEAPATVLLTPNVIRLVIDAVVLPLLKEK